jgi:hypothetical protein
MENRPSPAGRAPLVARRSLLSRLALAALAGLATAGASSAQTVTIDVGTRYQSVEGFGTCTSSGNAVWNPASWSAATGGNLGYIYAKDLGLTILRLYVEPNTLLGVNGVNSLGTVVSFGGNAVTDAAKINLNQSRTQYQDNAAKWLKDNALEPSAYKLIGAVWSPPHWMKEASGATVTDYAASPPRPPSSATTATTRSADRSSFVGDAVRLLLLGLRPGDQERHRHRHVRLEHPERGQLREPVQLLHLQRRRQLRALRPRPEGRPRRLARYGWATRQMGAHIAGVGDTPGNPWALLAAEQDDPGGQELRRRHGPQGLGADLHPPRLRHEPPERGGDEQGLPRRQGEPARRSVGVVADHRRRARRARRQQADLDERGVRRAGDPRRRAAARPAHPRLVHLGQLLGLHLLAAL